MASVERKVCDNRPANARSSVSPVS